MGQFKPEPNDNGVRLYHARPVVPYKYTFLKILLSTEDSFIDNASTCR